jgi:hypothetical protein
MEFFVADGKHPVVLSCFGGLQMTPQTESSAFASLAFDALDAIQGGCNGPCANGNCAAPPTSPLVSPLGSFGVGSSPADWDAAALALSAMANGQAPIAGFAYGPQASYGQPVYGQAMYAQPVYGQPVYGQPLYGPGSGTGTGGGLGNGMGPGPALVAAGAAPF